MAADEILNSLFPHQATIVGPVIFQASILAKPFIYLPTILLQRVNITFSERDWNQTHANFMLTVPDLS